MINVSAPYLLKVATYNIHSCIDTTRSVDTEKIAQVIARLAADVVALQEVDAHKPRTDYVHQAEWLARRLEMNHRFYPLVETGNEKYGLAVLSRFPMETIKFARLPALEMKKPREVRGAMWIGLDSHLGRVHLINTHLGLLAAERRRQIGTLLGRSWLGSLDRKDPVVFCGDFNAGRHSWVYRQVCRHFFDVRQADTKTRGPRGTFLSYFPMLRLDHIFVSRHFFPMRVLVPVAPPARTASDHLPVLAELSLSQSHLV